MKKNTNNSDDTKSFKENLNDTAKNVGKTFSAVSYTHLILSSMIPISTTA